MTDEHKGISGKRGVGMSCVCEEGERTGCFRRACRVVMMPSSLNQ